MGIRPAVVAWTWLVLTSAACEPSDDDHSSPADAGSDTTTGPSDAASDGADQADGPSSSVDAASDGMAQEGGCVGEPPLCPDWLNDDGYYSGDCVDGQWSCVDGSQPPCSYLGFCALPGECGTDASATSQLDCPSGQICCQRSQGPISYDCNKDYYGSCLSSEESCSMNGGILAAAATGCAPSEFCCFDCYPYVLGDCDASGCEGGVVPDDNCALAIPDAGYVAADASDGE